jgi:hypothetical protein
MPLSGLLRHIDTKSGRRSENASRPARTPAPSPLGRRSSCRRCRAATAGSACAPARHRGELRRPRSGSRAASADAGPERRSNPVLTTHAVVNPGLPRAISLKHPALTPQAVGRAGCLLPNASRPARTPARHPLGRRCSSGDAAPRHTLYPRQIAHSIRGRIDRRPTRGCYDARSIARPRYSSARLVRRTSP